MMTDQETDERTALDGDTDSKLAAVSDQDFVQGVAEWTGHDYATIRIPSEETRPKWEWDSAERQAFLFEKLREYGTQKNLPKSQGEYGEEFGVTQQQISQDIKQVRKYIAAHAGKDAVSKAEMLAHRAADEMAEDDPKGAMDAWLKYCEFLFDLGALDKAPDKKQVQTFNRNENVDLTDEEQEVFDQMEEIMADAQTVEYNEVDDDE